MTLDIITNEAAFFALETVWDPLLDSSATHSPFLAWDYVRLWWQHCGSDYQMRIGVVRDENAEVVGIAPFVIGADRGDSRQHLRHLGFMNGLGDVQGERMDILVPTGREAEITPLLASIISKTSGSWDVVRLNKLPEDSPNFPYLLDEMRRAGTTAGVLNQSECRCFDLPPTWDEYEKSKTGNFRRNIRRHWVQLFERHQAEVVRDMDLDERVKHFFHLHSMHWPDGVSSFLRPPGNLLHEALIKKWIPEGKVVMPFILIKGQPAGSVYAFCYKNEMLIYQLGWDKQYASISMGNMGVRAGVMEAIERGFTMADFLPGEYRYKREWSSRARYVSDLECFHRWHPRSVAFRILRAAKRRLAQAQADPVKPAAAETPEPEAESA
ncbi:MAG: GNAT family N-acetyltransferase [Verrucomicrobiota bacterium]